MRDLRLNTRRSRAANRPCILPLVVCSGRSFVVGFGINPPLRAHHAGSSCPEYPARCDWANFSSDKPNPQVLHGALVAGPEGPGDNTFRDVRDDYISNEVAVDYNSGFAGALAGLVEIV